MKKLREKIREIFKKNKKEAKRINFEDMSKKEKEEFLSNDLIERMIRVEQRVALSFGENIPYSKTKYYQNLKNKERENFEKYLIKKKRKKFLLSLYFLLPLILIGLIRVNFTGRVIGDNIGAGNLNLLEILSFIIAALFLFFGLVSLVFRKIKNRRFEKNFEIIDNIALRHRL